MKKYSAIYLVLFLLVGMALGFLLAQVNSASVTNILPQSCIVNGTTYKDGEGFMNDCNSCTCTNGQANCTLMACNSES